MKNLKLGLYLFVDRYNGRNNVFISSGPVDRRDYSREEGYYLPCEDYIKLDKEKFNSMEDGVYDITFTVSSEDIKEDSIFELPKFYAFIHEETTYLTEDFPKLDKSGCIDNQYCRLYKILCDSDINSPTPLTLSFHNHRVHEKFLRE